MSSRFVAGKTVEDALNAAEAVNRQGISVSLDSLGENVHSPQEAHQAAEVYHRLLDAIDLRKLDANVSLKLTQMGMDLQPDLAFSIAAGLVQRAAEANSFVRIDMEGSGYTQSTIDMVCRLHAMEGNRGRLGVVIQAYLYRSAADIDRLLAEGIRIRLCKGAYQEPATLAFPDKGDVDKNFVRLMQTLLPSGVYHGIATHDEKMIEATCQFARERGIRPDEFEFQMLYGVRRDLQRSLVAAGYRLRVYIPLGPIGIRTLCAGWRNGRPTCYSWPEISFASNVDGSPVHGSRRRLENQERHETGGTHPQALRIAPGDGDACGPRLCRR
jgi:proline dehydrogenase